jgi:hypothetical protein
MRITGLAQSSKEKGNTGKLKIYGFKRYSTSYTIKTTPSHAVINSDTGLSPSPKKIISN